MSSPNPLIRRWSPAPRAPRFEFHLNPSLLLLVLVAGLAVARPGRAEEAKGRRMYVEVGQFVFDEEAMPTVELRWGSVTPLAPSLDFVLPFAIEPAVITTPDLDLAVPIPLAPGMRVIPRAGVSVLFVYGGDIGAYALGWNAGAGLVVNAGGPVLRLDYTVRAFGNPEDDLNGAMHSVSAGLGWRF